MARKRIFPVKIYCRCGQLLYHYDKEGPGQLHKCFADRITRDMTGGGGLNCPRCGKAFARETRISGRKVFRLIGGRFYKSGHCGD